jgi:integron integrase
MLARSDVERFLVELTEAGRLAPKSRNQATSALAFFFREVVARDELQAMPRAREPRRVPSVLSHRQAALVLDQMSGKYRLLGSLMYGAGLRLTEAHQLRVKDVDFDLMQITVRDGKGGKDRWVMLPERLAPDLRRQIDRVRAQHEADRLRGAGWVALPHALARKDPSAGFELAWQFVFPSSRWSRDPATGRTGRYHLDPTATQREIKRAARASGIPKPVTCHTLRRTFATQMLRAGYDVRTVQKVMGHRDVRTTMIYVEAITDAGIALRSPLDRTEGRD